MTPRRVTIDGGTRNDLAAIDTNGGLLPWNPNVPVTDGGVFALAVSDGVVYVGGMFNYIGGTQRNGLAAIDTDGGLLAWNPSAPTPVTALAVSGSTIYVGASGIGQFCLSAIGTDGVLQPWYPNASGAVYALAVSGSQVYAGALSRRSTA